MKHRWHSVWTILGWPTFCGCRFVFRLVRRLLLVGCPSGKHRTWWTFSAYKTWEFNYVPVDDFSSSVVLALNDLFITEQTISISQKLRESAARISGYARQTCIPKLRCIHACTLIESSLQLNILFLLRDTNCWWLDPITSGCGISSTVSLWYKPRWW
jgi:hypothetical protein